MPRDEYGRQAAFGLTALCGALAVANVVELQVMSVSHGERLPWRQILWLTGPRWVLVAGLLLLVLGFARRFPISPVSLRVLSAHAAGFTVFGLAHAVMYTAVLMRSNSAGPPFSFAMQVAGNLLRTMPVLLLLYAATLGTARLVEATRERHARDLHASQLQAELSTSRLAALRAQLNPHFLYNTLHAISALIADNQNARALAANDHLAELLHVAFRADARALIPFSEEMTFVAQYLALQQMRFADRLMVSCDVDPAAADALIPPMLLQPIVENAVQHGLSGTVSSVTVRIACRVDANSLIVDIENDGVVVARDWSDDGGTGVGIPNTRGRLKTIYGTDAELRIGSRPLGGVAATLTVPMRRV